MCPGELAMKLKRLPLDPTAWELKLDLHDLWPLKVPCGHYLMLLRLHLIWA